MTPIAVHATYSNVTSGCHGHAVILVNNRIVLDDHLDAMRIRT